MLPRQDDVVAQTNQVVCCFVQQASAILFSPQRIKNVKLFVEQVDTTHNPVMVFHNRKIKLQRKTLNTKFLALWVHEKKTCTGMKCKEKMITHKIIL
jgi:poly(3-hydroxyalkanoate) synthetase